VSAKLHNLKTKGVTAFFWDFSGKMAIQGMSFIFSIFLARLLAPADFGLIAMVMVIIGIASVFTDVGLGSALIQRKRVLPVHFSSVFYFNIFAGSILSLITYFSAGVIGDFYQNAKLVPLAQVMSLAFVINAFGSVQSSKLRKELNYSALTKVSFIASLVGGIMGVSLAFNGAGVWSLVAQTLSMGVTYNVLIWSASKWVPALLFSMKALKQLWVFGFRMFLSGLLEAIFTRLDYLIIGKLFLPATLGFFQRAKSLNQMIVTYSSSSLMNVLFPILSNIQNDLPRFQSIVMKVLGVISFITFLLLGTFYLISEELITLLFGDNWLPSVHFFKILVLSGFAYPVSALLVNILSSRGQSKIFLRLEIYKKVFVAINLFVLFSLGIDFYLYGLIATAILGLSLNIFFASNEIQLSFSCMVKPIIVQAVLAVIAVLTTQVIMEMLVMNQGLAVLIAESISFAFLYFLMSKLLKTSSYCSLAEQIIPLIKKRF